MFDPRHTEAYHQQMKEIVGWMAGPKRDVTIDQLRYDIREVISDLSNELYGSAPLTPDMDSSVRGYYATLVATLHAASDGGNLWPYAMQVLSDCPWNEDTNEETEVLITDLIDDAMDRINVWDIANGYEG